MVIDASVAVKWLVPEPGADAAKAWLSTSSRLIAPGLLAVEVASALLRRMRDGTLSPHYTRQALDAWQAILGDEVVTLTSDELLLGPAIELSFEIRHPLADCLYLSLAESADAVLLTSDHTLHKRASKRCSSRLLNADD
ncbi:MAG: type II toxin-antitoxin system VapC family toxin [Tepidisphaeraceae bacterium]